MTLVTTYLGADAGRRVLDGAIARGTAESVRAVLWYSDLEGFTRIADDGSRRPSCWPCSTTMPRQSLPASTPMAGRC